MFVKSQSEQITLTNDLKKVTRAELHEWRKMKRISNHKSCGVIFWNVIFSLWSWHANKSWNFLESLFKAVSNIKTILLIDARMRQIRHSSFRYRRQCGICLHDISVTFQSTASPKTWRHTLLTLTVRHSEAISIFTLPFRPLESKSEGHLLRSDINLLESK